MPLSGLVIIMSNYTSISVKKSTKKIFDAHRENHGGTSDEFVLALLGRPKVEA